MAALLLSAVPPDNFTASLIVFVTANTSFCDIFKACPARAIRVNNSPVSLMLLKVSLAICLTPSKPVTKLAPSPVASLILASRVLNWSDSWINSIAPTDMPNAPNIPCRLLTALAVVFMALPALWVDCSLRFKALVVWLSSACKAFKRVCPAWVRRLNSSWLIVPAFRRCRSVVRAVFTWLISALILLSVRVLNSRSILAVALLVLRERLPALIASSRNCLFCSSVDSELNEFDKLTKSARSCVTSPPAS